MNIDEAATSNNTNSRADRGKKRLTRNMQESLKLHSLQEETISSAEKLQP